MTQPYPFLFELTEEDLFLHQAADSTIKLDFTQRVDGVGSLPEVVPTVHNIKNGQGFDSVEEALEMTLEPKLAVRTEAVAKRMIAADFFAGPGHLLTIPDGRKLVIWGGNHPQSSTVPNEYVTMYSYPYKLDGDVVTKYIPHPQLNFMAYWV